MELVHVQEDALEEIRQQAYQAACEVCEGAKLREGDLLSIRLCGNEGFFWQPSAVSIWDEP